MLQSTAMVVAAPIQWYSQATSNIQEKTLVTKTREPTVRVSVGRPFFRRLQPPVSLSVNPTCIFAGSMFALFPCFLRERLVDDVLNGILLDMILKQIHSFSAFLKYCFLHWVLMDCGSILAPWWEQRCTHVLILGYISNLQLSKFQCLWFVFPPSRIPSSFFTFFKTIFIWSSLKGNQRH